MASKTMTPMRTACVYIGSSSKAGYVAKSAARPRPQIA